MIAFVAAILYYVMKDVVQFPLGETSEPGAPGTVVLFVIGWAIYPIATAIEQFLQIGGADVALAVSIAACIYVVADVVNKVGFGIVAIQAAKVSSGINEVAPSAVDGK